MIVSAPKQAESGSITLIMILYHLHCADKDATILSGSGVLSPLSLFPPFEACPTRNLFQNFFGIEFHFDSHTYVLAISTFEFAHCFNLVENMQYRLSHEKYHFGMGRFDASADVPVGLSAGTFSTSFLCNSNCDVFSPNQFAAPAATI